MRGATPPLPLCRGAQLKQQDNFTFAFYIRMTGGYDVEQPYLCNAEHHKNKLSHEWMEPRL